jgi:hypothetical protein
LAGIICDPDDLLAAGCCDVTADEMTEMRRTDRARRRTTMMRTKVLAVVSE